MTDEERARKLVKMLEDSGELHGLLIVQGNVVLRNGGPVHVTDSPTMHTVADLQKAIELGLLQESTYSSASVSGSKASWKWWVPQPGKK